MDLGFGTTKRVSGFPIHASILKLGILLLFWNRQSVNIWSHLLGALAIVAVILIWLIGSWPRMSAPSETWHDRWGLAVFLLGALVCFACSTVFHVSSCHSRPVGCTQVLGLHWKLNEIQVLEIMTRVDYLGKGSAFGSIALNFAQEFCFSGPPTSFPVFITRFSAILPFGTFISARWLSRDAVSSTTFRIFVSDFWQLVSILSLHQLIQVLAIEECAHTRFSLWESLLWCPSFTV